MRGWQTLTGTNTASFKAMRTVFELRWPPKPITEKTTAEKQALLDETILKQSDLGKRMAASIRAEEELSHVVWVDKVERLILQFFYFSLLIFLAYSLHAPTSCLLFLVYILISFYRLSFLSCTV